jgi:protein-disulfide isomerase
MNMRVLAVLLAVPALLMVAGSPTLGQSEDELARLRQEIEALEQGQKALQRDLQDLKALLRLRVASPEAQRPQQVLTKPVILNIDGAPFLGSKDAKVTVVEFSDFQCPFCARHSRETMPAIVKEYVNAGTVKYVVLDFPMEALHPRIQKSHEAAHCAGEQGKYWEMHRRLFGDIRGQDERALSTHAKALRLDVAKFQECLAAERYAARVRDAMGEGQRAGVNGTPTFFVGVDGDGRTVTATRILRGAQPVERFRGAIDAVASEAPQP